MHDRSIQNMKKVKSLGILCAPTIVLLLLAGCFQNQNDKSAVKTVEEWVRLAPISSCDTNPTVETTGSMFTREFLVEFSCDPDELKKWIASSPGLNDARVSKNKGQKQIYTVTPGGGAAAARVEIDQQSNTVYVHTYWS